MATSMLSISDLRSRGYPRALGVAALVAAGLFASVGVAHAQRLATGAGGDADAAIARLLVFGAPTRAGWIAPDAPRLGSLRAATDLWLLAYLDLDRDDLEVAVARELGVPRAMLASTLAELIEHAPSEQVGADRDELMAAVALRDALATRGPSVSFAGSEGIRRDALLIDAVARALHANDVTSLAAMFGDPCAASCEEPWPSWSLDDRAALSAMAEASAAVGRLGAAAEARDPFAVAALDALREPCRSIEAHVVHPAPRVASELPMSTSRADEGVPTRADVIVAIGSSAARVVRVASVRVRGGIAERVPDERAVETIRVWIPGAREAREVALQRLTRRLRAMRIRPDEVVVVAVAEDARADHVGRVLASLGRAGVAPSRLVRRAGDGTLRGVPMQLVSHARAGARHGDLVVHGRTSGYVVTHRGDARVRAPNDQALAVRLARLDGRRLVLAADGEAPASRILDAAFLLGGGAPVTMIGDRRLERLAPRPGPGARSAASSPRNVVRAVDPHRRSR